MKYSSKQFLALLLSVTMAITPATGVWAENVSPEVSTEKTTEAVTEKTTEKAVETVAEKVTEKTAETVEKKTTEKTAEIVEEKTTEKTAETVEEKTTEKVTDAENETASEKTTEADTVENTEEEAKAEDDTEAVSENVSENNETTENRSETMEETREKKENDTEAATEEVPADAEKKEKTPDKESASEPDMDGHTNAVDSQTILADGVYEPESFQAITDEKNDSAVIKCTKVTVENGNAVATIEVAGEQYTYVKANGKKYSGTYENGNSNFVFPVDLNVENTMILFDNKAEEEITYRILVKLAETVAETENKEISEEDPAAIIGETTNVEETETETEVPNETIVLEETVTLNALELAAGEVQDGSYTTTADTGESMFKIVNVELTVKNGQIDAVVTLSGDGFNYLYKGTAENAANDQENWIEISSTETYVNDSGVSKTRNKFKITDIALDEPITIASCSKSKGEWKNRQITISSANLKSKVQDGSYTTTADTGESMFKIVNVELTVKNGQIDAVVTLSGDGFNYLYKGTAEDAANDTENWIEISDTETYVNDSGVTKTRNKFNIADVTLDEPIAIASCSKSKGEWKNRQITISSENLKEVISGETEKGTETETETEESFKDNSVEDPDHSTEIVDNSTSLADGTYSPENWEFSGGSGRTKIYCNKITVVDGKAYATIQFSSNSYDYVKTNGRKYITVNETGNSTFIIPVKLNSNNTILANTTAMSEPMEIEYIIHPVLSETAQTENETETEKETEKETEPTDTKLDVSKLQNGNYKVTVDSSQNKMFRVVDCVLTYKDGQMVARITMSGVGSDMLYMGTAANAPKDSANWIKASGTETNSEGTKAYYFEIPVTALDTGIALSSHAVKSDAWSDRVLIFQSAGMTLINADGTTETEIATEKETEKTNDKTADKESKYEADTSGATSAVDSSTGLADGVYTPDKFSWSGGSGRTSISCTKVTVSGGQAYATIVFGSSNYGYVKANGRKYYPTYSGGTSIFTIPVKLNANNQIIGMTTAMSAAHEVTYTIYIYIAGADKASDSKEKELNKDGLSEESPEIIGLEYTDEEEIEYAEYFKIYYYDQGITLIEVDMASDTDKPEKEEADAEEEMTGAVSEEELAEETAEAVSEEKAAEESAVTVSEEEMAEGATEEIKDATTIISELYQEKVVRYLAVPETAEVPVGLEKEMIIVNLPVESVYTDSEQAMETLEKLELEELVTVEGETAEKPEYKELVLNKCDLAILSDEFLWDEEKEELTLEEQSELLYEITERLTTLGIPAIVDRSADEKSEEAAAEWAKVYGVLFGCSDAAEALFQEAVQN